VEFTSWFCLLLVVALMTLVQTKKSISGRSAIHFDRNKLVLNQLRAGGSAAWAHRRNPPPLVTRDNAAAERRAGFTKQHFRD